MTSNDTGLVSDALTVVERELAALWAPAPGEAPKARTSTANVVLLATSAAREAVVAIADKLVIAELARTFVVATDPRLAPWGVEHGVAARCRPGEGQVLCAERIDLDFGASATARAASVVAALLVGEVPTIVAAIEPVPANLLAALAPLGDRLVVDSAVLGYEAVHRLVLDAPSRCVYDLAFARSATLRGLIASAFDDAAARSALRSVRRARVTAARGAAAGPVEARLLIGWLGGQLGWRSAKAGLVDASGRPVAVAIDDAPPSVDRSGALIAFDLVSDTPQGELRVTLSHDDHTPSYTLRRQGGAAPLFEKHARLTLLPREAQLDEGLACTDDQTTWRRALELARTL